jgi:hypothetical protein
VNSDNRLHVDQLRIDARATLLERSVKKLPRHEPGQKFLKGPIPLNWLSLAASQPGKALHVALALWFWAGMKRSRQVTLSMSWLRATLGVDRHSGYRGLAALEVIGLVSVVRHQGRKPIVTLLDTP